MSSKKRGDGWWRDLPSPEARKDHSYLPDNIGIGHHEHRDASGQIVLYFTADRSYRVALGKYANAIDDRVFYVSARTNWAATPVVEKFDHIIPAIAHIWELKEKFDEDLHNRTAR